MSELKRCPRCGAEAHVVTEDGEPTMFLCEDCGSWLDVSEFETTENAFKWWNDRPFIDALNARIAELEAAQRWIPVSERLPEVGKVVHVIDMNDTGGHLCNLYETAMLVEVSGNKRFGFIGHSGWDTSDVTHWMYAMPLPQPPEV
jgi:hypothetical protein